MITATKNMFDTRVLMSSETSYLTLRPVIITKDNPYPAEDITLIQPYYKIQEYPTHHQDTQNK